ncbi:hypothetical protein GB996_10685 [Psychrobacter sanguinis]|uniref:Uncharacterized protein n=2 Tax=Psychrobacter sanguinis TaxID=861445 RepID=A0A844M2S2_9GAMM|nr:hypothetical protein [Psychrobacter sanguinis]
MSMQDDLFSAQDPTDYPDPVGMQQTAHTKSWISTVGYALPYALAYVFAPSQLTQVNFPLSGIGLSLAVLLLLNIVVLGIFRATQKRPLEKIECHRIGVLTALLTLMATSLLMLHTLYDISAGEMSMTALQQNGVLPMLVISGAIGLFINYIAVTYGLWLLQKLGLKLGF